MANITPEQLVQINNVIKALCIGCGEVDCPISLDRLSRFPHCYLNPNKRFQLFSQIPEQVPEQEAALGDFLDNHFQTR